jgi:hypothetical protein
VIEHEREQREEADVHRAHHNTGERVEGRGVHLEHGEGDGDGRDQPRLAAVQRALADVGVVVCRGRALGGFVFWHR